MAVTKIKKQNTTYDINDARIPVAESADKYLHSKTEGGAVVLEWGDAPTELPEVTAAGKVLKTVSEDDTIVPAWGDFPTELPELPEGASEKTYVLKAVNGVLSWVEEVSAEVPAAAE